MTKRMKQVAVDLSVKEQLKSYGVSAPDALEKLLSSDKDNLKPALSGEIVHFKAIENKTTIAVRDAQHHYLTRVMEMYQCRTMNNAIQTVLSCTLLQPGFYEQEKTTKRPEEYVTIRISVEAREVLSKVREDSGLNSYTAVILKMREKYNG